MSIDWNLYIDKRYQLLGHKLGHGHDRGVDTPHHMGMYYVGMYLNKEQIDYFNRPLYQSFRATLDLLEAEPGLYRRHPDPNEWTYSPYTMSRDQSVALVIAMGFYGEKDRLSDLFWKHIKRFGFYPNTLDGELKPKKFPRMPDIALSPETWGFYIRAFWQCGYKLVPALLYPVVLLGDLFSCVASLVRVAASYKDQYDVGSDLNRVLGLTQAHYSMPTPLSWLSRKIFKCRKMVKGTSAKPTSTTNAVQSSIDFYYGMITRPKLNQLWNSIVARLF